VSRSLLFLGNRDSSFALPGLTSRLLCLDFRLLCLDSRLLSLAFRLPVFVVEPLEPEDDSTTEVAFLLISN
jgi:hypothetical protein